MNERKGEALLLADSIAAAASHHRKMERLISRYKAFAGTESAQDELLTDGEKYRWIRANRGNFEIDEALRYSDYDADFDSRITMAIRVWMARRDGVRASGPEEA